jgi:hypothetical protein
VPRRLARLGTVLAFASLVLVCGGIGGWAALGSELGEGDDGRGPWPLVLGAALGHEKAADDLRALGDGAGRLPSWWAGAYRRGHSGS